MRTDFDADNNSARAEFTPRRPDDRPSTVRSEETQKSQVDDETTERFIAEKHIGERIKRLRLKKSMGLVELGKHTGLSASFLSQLETGRVVPPCATWRALRWSSPRTSPIS